MRILAGTLLLLLIVLQGQLWFGRGSLPDLWRLRRAVEAQQEENRELAERNAGLVAEVDDLKSGLEAVEERARAELGMIREGETFYRVIEQPVDEPETPPRDD